jgi:endonuclease YncB( thermonuclease family)
MVSFFGLVIRIFAGSSGRRPGRDTRSVESRTETLTTLAITSGEVAGEVLWVLDGDTIDVRIDGRTIRVRLDAIDCPEDGQPWGNTAKAGLIKMIGRKPVLLEVHGVDDYGRMLATVFARYGPEGKPTNVNERMVMLGHAWVLRGYCAHLPRERQRQLFRLETWARSKKVGLWRTPDPVPPWKWRREQ